MAVAAVFGLIASVFVAVNGDESAYSVAQRQPMKLAAMEGLYQGQSSAPLVGFGVINSAKQAGDDKPDFLTAVKIPGLLSLLANRQAGSFVPGIDDLVFGNPEQNITGAEKRIVSGKIAVAELANYKTAKENGNDRAASAALTTFNAHQDDLGYGYLEGPRAAVPPVATTFYSFHLMVVLGTLFPLFFLVVLFRLYRGEIENCTLLNKVAVGAIFLGYIASQAGWVLAEVGRQPWAIQNLLPVGVAATPIGSGNVQTTFFIFLILFTVLLVVEIGIMVRQIKIGPEA